MRSASRQSIWQRKLLKASGQLHIAADRLAGLADAEANQRDLQLVADLAHRVEDDALFSQGASEDVVHLIEQQNLNVHGAHEANGDLFEFDHGGSRILRHAKRRQYLRVHAPLARLSSRLQGEDTRALDPGLAVEVRWVLGAKRCMIMILPMPLSP